MNVLQVTTDYPPRPVGGIGRYTGDLTAALTRTGLDVVVLTLSSEGVTAEPGIIRATSLGPPFRGPDARRSPLNLLQNNLSMLDAYVKSSFNTRFDIIHCQDIWGAIVAHTIASQCRSPMILTKLFSVRKIHESRIQEPGYQIRSSNVIDEYFYNYLMELEKWSIDVADHVISISNSLLSDVETTCDTINSKSSVIYCGVNIPQEDWKKDEYRDKIRLGNDGELLALLPGRIVWYKGGDIAVQAMSLLSHLPLRLVFAGTGPYQQHLQELAVHLGIDRRVSFLGYLDYPQLIDVYRSVDVVLAPSRVEAFGLAVAEALSLGKLVIASRVGGIPEQIRHRHNGLLFDVGDVHDLARQLQWMVDNPHLASIISKQAKIDSRSIYEWNNVAELTRSLYEALLQ